MSTKKRVTVIAIDRAERPLLEACKKLAKDFSVEVRGFLLVDTHFIASEAYTGDEIDGFFEECIIDFDNTSQVIDFFTALEGDDIVFHCREETAIQDYAKILRLVKGTYTQTPESLEVSTVKSRMRECFLSFDPSISPQFVELKSMGDYNEEKIKSLSFPVIVKPTGLNSSLLVNKCAEPSELKALVQKTFAELETIFAYRHGTGAKSVIIEEFLTGKLFSIDAYVDSNGSVTCLPPIRYITSDEVGKEGFYCYRSKTDHGLTEGEVGAANECAGKAIKAVGLVNSTVHVELCETTSGWKMIELGPRIGGGRQVLYNRAYGLDHFYNDLLIHYGKQPIVNQLWHRYASGFCVYADTEGIITAIEGVDIAKQIESVDSIDNNLSIGQEAAFVQNGGDYVLDCKMSNSSSSKLDTDFEEVRSILKVITA